MSQNVGDISKRPDWDHIFYGCLKLLVMHVISVPWRQDRKGFHHSQIRLSDVQNNVFLK